MTIAFRYFPYLVQQNVMDQMDLIEIFSIYSISKKSQVLARSYFNRHKFELHYFALLSERFWIHRDRPPKHFYYTRDHVEIEPMNGFKVSCKRSTRQRTTGTLTIPFSYSKDAQAREKIMKFARGLFPKLYVYLMFETADLAGFLDTMSFVKSFKTPIKRVKTDVHSEELLRAVMAQCSNVKNLQLRYISSSPFQYDFRTHVPLKFDYFELICSRLVTKDYLRPLFWSCKKIILNVVRGVSYTDQELTEICKQWLESPKTQYLQIQKVRTATEGIWKLPGAVRVQEVTIGDNRYPFGKYEFDQGKCRMMKKADGTPAIVYQDKNERIYFQTDFHNAVIR